MKRKVIFGTVFLLYFVVCLKNRYQPEQKQSTDILFNTSTTAANDRSANDLTTSNTSIFEKMRKGFFITPLYSKKAIRFEGYNEGTGSSLLVVERWESFSDDDHSTDNFILTRSETDNTTISTGEYSVMLLHANGIKKMKFVGVAGKYSAVDVIAPSVEKKKTEPLFR